MGRACPTTVLEAASLADIAELCRRSMAAPPTEADLGRALFDTGRPAVVRGDPDVGVVATVERRGRGHVRLLVVDPAARGRGVGAALLAAAEDDLFGLSSVVIGADAPDYLWPGSPLVDTALLTLAEARGYRWADTALNLVVDLSPLPERDGIDEGADVDRDELVAWLRQHWSRWEDEAVRALDGGTLVVSIGPGGIEAVCAWDVNRAGWLGPVAVRPDLRGGGIGSRALVAALHRMRDGGRRSAEVAWVSTVAFYAKAVGARVGDAYAIYVKER